jgi:hypothetical protein
LFKRIDRIASILQRLEIQLTCVSERIIGQSVQHSFCDESQRALRADHQVDKDIERRVEVEEGVQEIAVVVL